MGYEYDRAWSDRFLPQLRALIGPHLLVPSTLEQDTKQAADLVVLTGRNMTIACRVRRYGFALQYPRQFTLRSRRDNGVMTEFRKVIMGWGDWFFYGHSNEPETQIDPWFLIDLASFRQQLAREAMELPGRREIRHGDKPNGDGTHFKWFDVDSFQVMPPLLIAESSHPWPARGRVAQWPRPVPSVVSKPSYAPDVDDARRFTPDYIKHCEEIAKRGKK